MIFQLLFQSYFNFNIILKNYFNFTFLIKKILVSKSFFCEFPKMSCQRLRETTAPGGKLTCAEQKERQILINHSHSLVRSNTSR